MHRVNLTLYKRYRFFHEQAGHVAIIDANGRPSGIAARNALDLARAEQLLDEAEELEVAATSWVDDDEPYDYNPRGRGFEDADAEEAAKRFDSNEWTGPYGCTIALGDDEHAASLWGIVLNSRGASDGLPGSSDDPYARVVRAELASEIEDELRQAIGDKLDTLDGALY